MADDEKQKVVVISRLQNAIALRVDDMVDSNDCGQPAFSANTPGIKTARLHGDFVEVRPGRNEIDADFWRAWSEQNKGGAMAASFEIEEPPKGN